MSNNSVEELKKKLDEARSKLTNAREENRRLRGKQTDSTETNPSLVDLELTVDSEGFVLTSAGALRNLDFPAITGKNLTRLTHPEDETKIDDILDETTGNYDKTIRIKTGSEEGYRWLKLIRGRTTKYERKDAEVLGFRDVSKRKDFQQKLEGSQKRLWQVIDLIPNVIYGRDEEGKYVFANEALANLYDAEPDEVIGRTDSELGSRGIPKEFIADDLEVIAQDAPSSNTEILPEGDGGQRVMDTRRIPYRIEGSGKSAVLVIATDVTEKVKSKKELDRRREFDDFRARAWKVSSKFSSDREEGEVIRELLGTVGPFFSVHNISFLRLHASEDLARVEEVWSKSGGGTGKGEEIPLDILRNYAGQSHVKINFNDLPEDIRERLEPVFSQYGARSVLLTPYGNPDNPDGYLAASSRSGDRDWSPCEIGLLEEVSEILNVNLERRHAERKLRYREKFENLVAEISARFVDAHAEEINKEINRALRLIGKFSDVDRAYLFQFRQDGQLMDNTHEWTAEGIEPERENLQELPTDTFPWWMRKLRRRETIHVPRVADMKPEAGAEQEILQSQDIQSVIVVPIVSHSNLLGYMGFDSVRSEKSWPDDIITLLQMVAEVFGNSLGRENLERRLEDLHEIARDLHRNDDRSEVCQQVVEAAEKVIDLSNSLIALREGDELVPKASSSSIDSDEVRSFKVGEGVAGRTVEENRPIWGNTEEIPEVDEENAKYGSILSVPIGDIGNFQAISERRDAFNENDLTLATLLASHIEDELLRRKYENQLVRAKNELEESRKKYKRLVENQGEGIISVDQNREIVFANPAAAEIVGLNSAERIEGNRITRYIQTDEVEKIEEEMANNSGKETFSQELEVTHRRTKEKRILLVTATPRLDGDNDQIGTFAIFRDVTERVEAEEELKELNERMKEMSRMVAHELRTPLTTIKGYADMLRDGVLGELTEEQVEMLDKISRSSNRLSDLVKNFLDLEKIDAGELEMGLVRFDLTSALEDNLEEFRERAIDRGLNLNYQVEESLTITGDRQKLLQAISNLISNAIKFTKEGRVELRASTSGDNVKIIVEDEGVGIKQEELERIFDKFYQAASTEASTAKGTGLGLTFVKKIIESHDGRISVSSEKGEGTKFTILLPVSEAR